MMKREREGGREKEETHTHTNLTVHPQVTDAAAETMVTAIRRHILYSS